MIELLIKADNAADLIATINGLSTLGSGKAAAPAPVEYDADAEMEEIINAVPQSEARAPRKGGRPRKAPESSASTAAETSGETGSAENRTASPPTSSDVFSDQIKQANAEAAADRANEPITLESLNARFAEVIGTGKKFPSMRDAQEFLKSNFQSAAGEPCRRLGEVKTEDYPRLHAALRG